jgi:hypothetical protein
VVAGANEDRALDVGTLRTGSPSATRANDVELGHHAGSASGVASWST